MTFSNGHKIGSLFGRQKLLITCMTEKVQTMIMVVEMRVREGVLKYALLLCLYFWWGWSGGTYFPFYDI